MIAKIVVVEAFLVMIMSIIDCIFVAVNVLVYILEINFLLFLI